MLINHHSNRDTAGTYTVMVNGKPGTFVVKEAAANIFTNELLARNDTRCYNRPVSFDCGTVKKEGVKDCE